MNNVTIIGNLTADPRPFGEGTGISFSIAYNRRVPQKDGKSKDEVFFFDCVSFRNVETLLKYLRKGHKIGVTGSLKQERWDFNGETRSKVVIVVNSVDFLSTKKTDNMNETTDETADNESGFWS
jgi:single-strand DNA-binding protein